MARPAHENGRQHEQGPGDRVMAQRFLPGLVSAAGGRFRTLPAGARYLGRGGSRSLPTRPRSAGHPQVQSTFPTHLAASGSAGSPAAVPEGDVPPLTTRSTGPSSAAKRMESLRVFDLGAPPWQAGHSGPQSECGSTPSQDQRQVDGWFGCVVGDPEISSATGISHQHTPDHARGWPDERVERALDPSDLLIRRGQGASGFGPGQTPQRSPYP